MGMPTASRRALRGFATAVLITTFAGDMWRNGLSWWGFGAIALAILITSCTLIVRSRPLPRLRVLPVPLVAFTVLAVLSIAWSGYRPESAIGVVIQLSTSIAAVTLVLLLSWAEIVQALGRALRIILGLSLAFELLVAVVVRQPVMPFFTDYGPDAPAAFAWTRGELLSGGRIQGVVGNANLLAMVALLALVVVALQLAARTLPRRRAVTWIVVALATLALTGSSTVLVALVMTGVVAALALLARRVGLRGRLVLAGGVVVAAVGAAVVVATRTADVFELLGRSPDLTGRFEIWESVLGLWQQHPVLGWGWIGYWAPWVHPFEGLAVRSGVTYLQAHDAYLDVLMQLGVVGLLVFACLVVTTYVRSWWAAIDRPQHRRDRVEPYTALALAPLLLMTALVVQSLAESRLLYEGNWLLLVVIAIATRSGMVAREDVPGPVDSRRRDAPARPGAAAASSAVPSTAAASPVGAAPAPSIATADPGVA
ncbi:O-Antigen ligase [Clavibacter michiganensis]|uniref:O-Antigen ligase n=1 Tax=Clavibacter michiganensis TaxID=28447 RepID=A0A251XS72_9MICO|nr:O-Antigen ligase [Clavibacter michiganensis]